MYGSATPAATIRMHCRMNELVDWRTWHGENDNKKCGIKKKKHDFCQYDPEELKLKTEHQKSVSSSYFQFLYAPGPVTFIADYRYKEMLIAFDFPFFKVLIVTPRDRLYILYCVFLI